MIIPHTRVIESYEDFSKTLLNDAMRKALQISKEKPCCLELTDGSEQRLLFFRASQIYAAGLVTDAQFTSTTIREFVLASGGMNFPQLTLLELNNKLLHSLLIIFQKKHSLRVVTTLVDFDELLDGIEAEGKSCIVNASREHFMMMLRYEKGAATALGHELSILTPREGTFREEFLVKIYTVTAEKPLTISLYEDLLVTYAEDAKTIPDSFQGKFEDLYLSKPPIISLQFKGKEVDHWVFDKPIFNIGRTPDNDIAIDNLSVSRLHAVLEEEKGQYYIRDCDSLNGTVLNDQKIGRSRLENGDQISIGKHTIVFRRQGGRDVPAEETVQGFDQTMIITKGAIPRGPAPSKDGGRSPRLIFRTDVGDRIVEMKNGALTIGKDESADVSINGMFVAGRHAEIVLEDDRVILRHLGGLRRVRVDGKVVREIELKDNAEIEIANEAFIFQE